MYNQKFIFPEEQFNRLFPFYFIIDSDLKVLRVGKSLSKLLPEMEMKKIDEIFIFKRPGHDELSFQTLGQLNQLIIIESKGAERITLRGQFEFLEDSKLLLFAGTPWFYSMDQVKEKKLTLHDFAINDPMIDLLQVLKTEEIVSGEVKELLEHMQRQKNESQTTAQRLGQLITNLQAGILLEDENRKIVLTNNTFCQMFGIPVPPEQMVGWDCSLSAEQSKHLFTESEAFVEKITDLLKEKKQSLEEKWELVDGRVFERDYIPMYVENVYRGHLWKYTDITERSMKQDQLRKSEEKYRGIISNINLGLIEVDLNDEIRYVNQSFCFISGYSENELLGKNPNKLFLVDPETLQKMQEINESRTYGASTVYEIEVIIKDGLKKWWLISGAPLYNDAGKVEGSIGIHLDITEQKNLEKQLREAKMLAEKSGQAKEVFLANMSHEIRTPLSGIYGMMQLLQGTRLNKEQGTYVKAIDKAIENLQTIINDILDFSKINAGMIEIDNSEFSLKEEVEAIYRINKPRAIGKELDIFLQYHPSLSEFYTGDAHRIGQVLTNLIGNSLKFTEKGNVTIECRLADKTADKHFVDIIVTDTGIGIEKEYLPFIFDKFTQEESGQVKKFGGTGLGMSISRQLVELMNGTITVSSEKNIGTRVSVIIPLKAAKGKSVTALKTVESGLLVSKKILVAEDNEINATVIKSLLTREGAHVLLVNNGKELIDAIAKEDFDLVISDLQMPVMGGMEAVKWVRKHKPPTQQIIALTANAFKEERERCLEAGFNEVLFKPFKKEDLIKACIDNNYQNSNNEYAGQVNASPKLYNLDSLTEMVDGNKDQVAYLIQQFLEETPRKIEKIKIALQQDKGKEIRRVVHYLSSSLHHMSVTALYDSIKKIETSKRNKLSKNQQMEVKHFCEMTQLVVDQIREDYPANNSLVK